MPTCYCWTLLTQSTVRPSWSLMPLPPSLLSTPCLRLILVNVSAELLASMLVSNPVPHPHTHLAYHCPLSRPSSRIFNMFCCSHRCPFLNQQPRLWWWRNKWTCRPRVITSLPRSAQCVGRDPLPLYA